MDKIQGAINLKLLVIKDEKQECSDLINILEFSFSKTKKVSIKKYKKELREEDYDLIILKINEDNEEEAIDIIKNIQSNKKNQKLIISLSKIPSEELFLYTLDINTSIYLNQHMPKEVITDKINQICEIIQNEKLVMKKQKEAMLDELDETMIEDYYINNKIKEKRLKNKFFKHIRENKEDNLEFIEKLKKIIKYEQNLTNVEMNSLNGYTKETLNELGFNLKKIKEIFILNKELTPMGMVVGELSDLVKEIVETNTELEEKNQKMLTHLKKDLTQFLFNLFLEGDTEEFNYLTDSYQSSIIQLRANIFKEEIEDEGEDEFFL